MARALNTLLGRILLFVLVSHAVLLPLLYLTLSHGTRVNAEDTYLDYLRGYSRFIADLIENQPVSMPDSDVVALMDSVVLGHDGVYAELRLPDRNLRSSIVSDADEQRFKEDFAFNSHDDEVYYLSMPVKVGEQEGQLNLGFSESDTAAEIARLHRQILISLVIYLLLAVLISIAMGVTLSRPLSGLQKVSRQVALGDFSKTLDAQSSIAEVVELAHDLEFMRHELVQVNTRLKTEIAERQVLEAKLRHSQRVETIGTMAGGIAHEFNNILVPITLYTNVVIEDLPEGSELRGYLLRVQRAARRARELVHKILAFSRQLEVEEKQPEDLAKIVREATDLFSSLSHATLDIEVEITEEPCFVYGDATMLHQVVLNLCTNALKAIPGMDGRIRITLTTETRHPSSALQDRQGLGASYATLTVEDNGMGMDAATSERIFEPFYTTRRVGEGTGLGLSVVHGIVLSHGGDIMVSSDLGMGSVFTIHLPLIPEGKPLLEQAPLRT
ncbi:MAG: ATP-binding protein [Gammaproteobacteria bacterium]|nr:ATP-binding protein [Gammaproteobacteria bacterium]